MTDLADWQSSLLSDDYVFVRQIAHGGPRVVYQAISTRGRLRGRHLALKRTTLSERKHALSLSLHQGLHHPNTLTLYSTICASDFDYHILEYCSGGSLLDLLSSRNPSQLSEIELRHVLKGMANALAYLHEERVIHRNVCSSNILLVENLRPKLCDFKHAVYLQDGDRPISEPFEFAAHPAPELSQIPTSYNFAVDAWALGCVVRSCIGIADGPRLASWDQFNASISTSRPAELQDLLVSLLLPNPKDRLDATVIMKHGYLTETVSPSIPSGAVTLSNIRSSTRLASLEVDNRAQHESTPFPKYGQVSSFRHSIKGRIILKDVGNITTKAFRPNNTTCSPRRVASDPVPGQHNMCLSEWKFKDKSSSITATVHSDATKATFTTSTQVKPNRISISIPGDNAQHQVVGRAPRRRDFTPRALPIGTTRPQPIDTTLLGPKTYKLANGSITILPSRSILVDFRQSDRRQGLKGDQVLLLDSTGTSVKVFRAPHLSVPSCLVEPIEEHDINDLPSLYWKQVNDARHFIDQIKQKTPQMTVYTSDAKCSLMANCPDPDIEILLYAQDPSEQRFYSVKPQEFVPILRIRLSQQRRSIEFAQRLTCYRGTEWKKKIVPILDVLEDISGLLHANDLNQLERKGVGNLAAFLQTCRKLESPSTSMRHNLPMTLSSLDLPARPSRLKSTSLNRRDLETFSNIAASDDDPAPSEDLPALKSRPPSPASHTSTTILSISSQRLFPETRYIPTVGWCMRLHNFDDQSNPRYQMMFSDGVSLEVNTEENKIIFSPTTGEILHCQLADRYSHPEVGKRMCFLKNFMSLYE